MEPRRPVRRPIRRAGCHCAGRARLPHLLGEGVRHPRSIGGERVADATTGGRDAHVPLLPGGKWHVHDGKRPQPTAVTPGTTPGAPPSDAVVLFDGHDLSRWQAASGGPARWNVEAGELVVAARTGNIATRDEFGDCQL